MPENIKCYQANFEKESLTAGDIKPNTKHQQTSAKVFAAVSI